MSDTRDLAARTVAVLNGLIRDHLADERTTECLQHARECVTKAMPLGPQPLFAAKHADGRVTRHVVNPVVLDGHLERAPAVLGAVLSMECKTCPDGFRHEVSADGAVA